MSSKNDDNSGIALVVGGFAILAYFLMFVLLFVAFVLTILALLAWSRPLRLGKIVITPEEARRFVFSGLAGAFLLPAFCVFLDLVLGVRINWAYATHIVLAGYVLGSIGIEIIISGADEGSANVIETLPPQLPPSRAPSLPRSQAEPFRYASWNDDEEMKG